MSKSAKVIVAMSGGVDSSVAACLLQQRGYDCVGAFIRVGAHAAEAGEVCALDQSNANDVASASRDARVHVPMTNAGDSSDAVGNPSGSAAAPARRFKHGCCSASDAIDARAIAGKLDIPFYALNFEHDFDAIIDYFVDEYGRARTPNPCVVCNIDIKFGKLLRYADMLDAAFIATGHYARIGRDAAGRPQLLRGRNRAKDQSYVLFGIRRADLGRCLFPLGEIDDKAEVRRIAAALGLRVHDKPDSQEICFVPGDDYKQLLRERRPELMRAGEIRDAAGAVLGTHEGVAGFTIGQRRGLGVALGAPAYVTKLDVLNNTVTLGPRKDLLASGLIADEFNWLVDPPAPGETLDDVEIKIRHQHAPAAGTLTLRDDGAVVGRFVEPQVAVTPGQAAVFYRGEVVLGGGWIREALPATESASTAHSARDGANPPQSTT